MQAITFKQYDPIAPSSRWSAHYNTYKVEGIQLFILQYLIYQTLETMAQFWVLQWGEAVAGNPYRRKWKWRK
jgi:hypothetical protein